MILPIYAPKDWWDNKDAFVEKACNGCGSELDLSGKLVPDTIYGLNIREYACCPHDFGYVVGSTWMDKIFIDVMFLYNMTALIVNKGGWLMIPRLLRASKYFVAVVSGGDDSYSHEKIIKDDKEITIKGEFRDV